MSWLLQVKFSVISHNQQGVGHRSICLSKEHEKEENPQQKKMLPQKRRPQEKEPTESGSKGVVMKISNTTGHCCTIILLYFTSDHHIIIFYKWRPTRGTKRRKGRLVMAKGEGESEDTLQKALQIELVSLILCWKPLFVILHWTTAAREPWYDFYLRKKGQCFIQVLLEPDHLNDMGSLPF